MSRTTIPGLARIAGLVGVVACSRGRSAAPPVTPAPALLSESFDGAHGLADWKEIDGAVDGDGPASTVALDDGGVRLEGGADTRHWRALERAVALGDAPWVRFSARARTEGLVADGAHHTNCNLYVRFADAAGKRLGELAGTHAVLGTTPWAPIARRVAVPSGAASVTVGVFLSLPGRAWFDDVRVEAVPAPDWHEATEGHYRFHWLGADAIPEVARAYDAESFRRVAEFLGLDPRGSPAAVDLFKYPDAATKEELMGEPGNAFTMPDGSIHTIFATDRHEIVHVLARPWGRPPALLGEGLAVYLSGAWQGKPVVDYARGLVDEGWIPLSGLLDTVAFRRRPDLATYPIAGALIEWMLAQPGGKATLRTLYGELDGSAPPAKSRRTMEDLLGATLEQVDAKLRAWLRAR